MALDAAMVSSASCEWATPQALVDRCAAECGGFDLDPCCEHGTAKASRYYTATDDGLRMPWWGTMWINPPWSRDRSKLKWARNPAQPIAPWLRAAYQSTRDGDVQCAYVLVPARPDTKWWARWVLLAHEVRMLKGRVKFDRGDGRKAWSAPFPSALLIYRAGPLPPAPAVWLSWDARGGE